MISFLKLSSLKAKPKIRTAAVLVLLFALVLIAVFCLIWLRSKETDKFRSEVVKTRGELSLEMVGFYYDKIGADQLLDVIEEDKYCHEKGHSVGRVVYKKTQNLSLSLEKCSHRCSTGCFHGVLMELFNRSDQDPHVNLESVKDQINTICKTEDVVKNNIQYGVCVHGIGHTLMFLAENDLGLALEYCGSFSQPGEEYYCATGVFMEWDRVNGKRDKGASGLFPCDKYDFPSACFRYKISKAFKAADVNMAKEFCSSIKEGALRSGCFHGIGFSFFRLLNDHPLKYLCDMTDTKDAKMCVEGAIGIFSVFDKQRSIERCKDLVAEEQSYCLKAGEQSNFGMEKDFSDYLIRTNE
jgi:hypothetical protein